MADLPLVVWADLVTGLIGIMSGVASSALKKRKKTIFFLFSFDPIRWASGFMLRVQVFDR